MKRLTIVQPYVPAYRVPFFNGLVESLATNGIECRVVAGQPDRTQSARADQATASWLTSVPVTSLRLAGKTLTLGGTARHWRGSDAVVVGHLGSSLDTYRAILDAKHGRLKVGLWGHIKNYVNTPNPIDTALERWQLRAADHVFAYTPGGADYARSAGVDDPRITTVMNTIDTTRLEAARDQVTEGDINQFRHTLNNPTGPVFAYIGGLDESKRIEFLVQTLDLLWTSDPEIHLAVAGRGEHESLLKAAVARGQVTMLGYADERTKALLAAVATAIVNPGRIGLLAIDALVLGLPILTTEWPYHAPENEYLHEGYSRITSRNDMSSFAQAIVRHATIRDRAWDLAERKYPTLDQMITHFAVGVAGLLSRQAQP